MKTRPYTIALLLMIVLLAACQSGKPTVQSTQAPAAAVQTEESVSGTESYPAPAQSQNSTPVQSSAVMYPDPKSGDEVSWAQAQAMILNNEVTKVFVSKSLQVTLTLKDGRSLITLEPSEGSMVSSLKNCGVPCQGVEIELE